MSTIVTGEAVRLELPVARLGSRVVAGALDLVVQVVALLLGLYVVGVLAGSLDAASLLAVLVVVLALIFIGYPVLMETFTDGRTLGKMAMGLRVVRDDGGPIVARHALVRGLAGFLLEKPGFFGFGFGIAVGVFSSGAREDAKRVGDLLAGTIVISERVPNTTAAPPPMPPWLMGWAQSLDLAGLDDPTALQARQLLGRLHSLTPQSRAMLVGGMTAAVLGRVSPPPPAGTDPVSAVSAVLAERRRRDLDTLLARQRRATADRSGVAVYDRV